MRGRRYLSSGREWQAVLTHGFSLPTQPNRALLRTLKTGDRLQLAAGDYMNGLPVHHPGGLPRHPIVIAGPAAPARAVFHTPDASTVSIVDSACVEPKNRS